MLCRWWCGRGVESVWFGWCCCRLCAQVSVVQSWGHREHTWRWRTVYHWLYEDDHVSTRRSGRHSVVYSVTLLMADLVTHTDDSCMVRMFSGVCVCLSVFPHYIWKSMQLGSPQAASLAESNGSLPLGGWHIVSWLPVHQNQLWAQRSVTSMGSLYLFRITKLHVEMFHNELWKPFIWGLIRGQRSRSRDIKNSAVMGFGPPVIAGFF